MKQKVLLVLPSLFSSYTDNSMVITVIEDLSLEEVEFKTKDNYLFEDFVKKRYSMNEYLKEKITISEIKRASKIFNENKFTYNEYLAHIVHKELDE